MTPRRLWDWNRRYAAAVVRSSSTHTRNRHDHDDPQTRIGRLPPLLAQGQSKDRTPPQSRHVQDARRRRKARARCTVFQAALAWPMRYAARSCALLAAACAAFTASTESSIAVHSRMISTAADDGASASPVYAASARTRSVWSLICPDQTGMPYLSRKVRDSRTINASLPSRFGGAALNATAYGFLCAVARLTVSRTAASSRKPASAGTTTSVAARIASCAVTHMVDDVSMNIHP